MRALVEGRGVVQRQLALVLLGDLLDGPEVVGREVLGRLAQTPADDETADEVCQLASTPTLPFSRPSSCMS